jgi:Tfp pilus assembly protein PilF
MKNSAALSTLLLLGACATAPVTPVPDKLFDDAGFAAPSQRISAKDVFALSDEMRSFLSVEIASELQRRGRREGLVNAIRERAPLKLEYESAMTRNAAQAFADRAGNCLSLVIMTAALAKQLGLSVRFQSVPNEQSVDRIGNTQYFIGHVNLTLSYEGSLSRFNRFAEDAMVVDFVPPRNLRGLATLPLDEQTIVAMYMNNRAVESLAQEKVDDAYWWARAALAQDPRFISSYNTLGVVYLRRGDLPRAEKAFVSALERDQDNTRVMANLARVYSAQGRAAEARLVTDRLQRLEPDAAFSYFDRGMEALYEGDYARAAELLGKEVARAPQYHEFHFWLAVADVRLGRHDAAREQLALAMQYSTTPEDRDIYARKIERIRAATLH